MMHKESPPQKNSFLEDLDRMDVSVSGANYTYNFPSKYCLDFY